MDRLEIFNLLATKAISKAEALRRLKAAASCDGAATDSLAPMIASVRDCVAAVLHIDADAVPEEYSFAEMGVDSISGLEIVRDLNLRHGLNLDSTVLYDHPHVASLASHLAEQSGAQLPPASRPATPPAPADTPVAATDVRTTVSVRPQVAQLVGEVLHLDTSGLEPNLTFQEMGFDSISGLELIRDCNTRFGLNLDSVVIYDHPDIDQLSAHIDALLADRSAPSGESKQTTNRFESEELQEVYHDSHFSDLRRQFLQETAAGQSALPAASAAPVARLRPVIDHGEPEARPATPEPPTRSQPANTPIAVVGMAGVFPDAPDVDSFWENLRTGVTSMRPVPQGRWRNTNGVQNYSQTIRPALLDDIESFDSLFFNISPIDAEVMDPQQRVFLEIAHQAFEDAGLPDDQLARARVGVFVGAAQGDYQKRFDGQSVANQSQVFAGNAASILPARISYFLDLKGPSVVIDTACSSSLVATHYACQSLRTGEVDVALAGGIRLMVTDELYVQASDAGMVSPTGECRAFDARADGIAMGEAAAAIVLKRHDQAVADGDRIYGIIVGSGVNQDGHTNGITAPSPRAQSELEVEVYEKFGIDPRQITLVEAHGTGTALGDPIEVKALGESFARYTDDVGFCELGSVKNNIGHTTMAAGISSLIKVLKAMQHRTIPPLANYEQLNPRIDLAGGPFRIETQAHPWEPPQGFPRTAALSSFGFSGTNCHMVIQEVR